MSARLGSVHLPVQHAGEGGYRQPFARPVRMREYPPGPMQAQPLGNDWILIDIDFVVVIDEPVSQGLAENGGNRKGWQEAERQSQPTIGR